MRRVEQEVGRTGGNNAGPAPLVHLSDPARPAGDRLYLIQEKQRRLSAADALHSGEQKFEALDACRQALQLGRLEVDVDGIVPCDERIDELMHRLAEQRRLADATHPAKDARVGAVGGGGQRELDLAYKARPQIPWNPLRAFGGKGRSPPGIGLSKSVHEPVDRAHLAEYNLYDTTNKGYL